MSKKFTEVPSAEPYKIKVVEQIKRIPREERIKSLNECGLNPFMLKSEDIYIDLETDSGTTAMSDKQWAALLTGDESYSGSKSFYNLEKSVQDVLGYKYVIPAHQGRGAENILIGTITEKDKYVVSNMFFGTGATHIVSHGGFIAELVIDNAQDFSDPHPFKGNVDIEQATRFVEEKGAENISYFMITCTNNQGGGQPVSMENMRTIRELTSKYNIPLYLDFARFAENMYFIKEREDGYQDKSIREILREFTSYTDGCVISAKKDGLVNIGGLCCVNDSKLYEELAERVINFEGFIQYGGLSGRDMEALAQGIQEVVEFSYLDSRINQIQYLGKLLQEGDVPILTPIGGHAVYIDAMKMFPHIPQSQYPALALCNEIYIEGGVRTSEIGTLCAGFDPITKEQRYPALDMCRLAIPRRAYTKGHIEYIAETIIRVNKRAREVRGLEFIHEYKTQSMRYFLSKFRWVK